MPQFLLSPVASIHGRPRLAFQHSSIPAFLRFRPFPKPDFIAF